MSQVRNLPASVSARLKAIADQKGEPYGFVLERYGRERFLYRLACSAHAGEFVLKGATLVQLWTKDAYRPTRDVDLLGFGPSDELRVRSVMEEVIATPVEDDGLEFVRESVRAERIREGQRYDGIRLKLLARLGTAHIDLQVDVGFGDAVSPEPQPITLPPLLDFPAAIVRAYPREAVIAEKFEAMVRFGVLNSRMKDFYDILVLSRISEFDGDVLGNAIRRTFDRREAKVPSSPPSAFTEEFSSSIDKQKQWRAFRKKTGVRDVPDELVDVVKELRQFLGPVVDAEGNGRAFSGRWIPGAGWSRH